MEFKEIKTLVDLMRYMDEQGISADDPRRHRAYGRFLDNKARNAGTPLSGIFELTPLCNFDCKMCYVHLTKEQMGDRTVLSGEQWINMIDEAIELGMISCQLTGGEAMMHPDFDDIYLHLWQRGISVALLTNGVLLTEERIAFLKKYPPSSLQITIYGGSDDDYERLTGRRAFQTVLSHVTAAKEIGCRIVITATPSHFFGKKELEVVRKFAQEQELKLKVNSELNFPREETGRKYTDFAMSEEEIFDLKVYLAGKEVSELEKVVDAPAPGNGKEPAYGIRCGAGRDLFCISWDGKMKACLDLEAFYEPLKIGFAEAWKRLHAYVTRYEIPRECIGCVYLDVCNPCPVIHAMGAPAGHVDRRICQRTKRLVETGCIRLPRQMEEK